MADETPVQSRAFWRWWLLAACALLLLSEVLWLWHSWTLRDLLETEPVAAGSAQ